MVSAIVSSSSQENEAWWKNSLSGVDELDPSEVEAASATTTATTTTTTTTTTSATTTTTTTTTTSTTAAAATTNTTAFCFGPADFWLCCFLSANGHSYKHHDLNPP